MLLIERPGEAITLLRLNRPDRRNAIATPLLAAIADALDEAARDDAVRAVVITGSVKVFAAGADIGEMADKTAVGALADVRPALWARLRAFPKPLVAAVEGWCLGAGNELLMCCDLAVAGAGAKFGQPETNLGIMPGAGGTATLPRLVGRTAAMKMVLLGDPIDAAEARALGLIAAVVADGGALDEALAWATRLATRAPLALRQAKAMVTAAFDLPHQAHLQAERQAFALLFSTADKAEGVAAFLERRPPDWTGT
ncbi:enoyl-CoA hydratase-related protein [Sphingomonas naphthae]|uniref:Enoyl-CoA hydratase-related protein n=1 Tax=Sphingomonas naphthae TaxID=1813468 RepID=A0ABY7TH32_9SPHN|nr:enoyl-CoA hydratase-related protein [Sphingomonas naphthae]WCT72454.1 enoyl-CoA hydratase-related protein [Sphingomonas naphthae]